MRNVIKSEVHFQNYEYTSLEVPRYWATLDTRAQCSIASVQRAERDGTNIAHFFTASDVLSSKTVARRAQKACFCRRSARGTITPVVLALSHTRSPPGPA